MFAFTLESLVLRGSVLRDVLAVSLRLVGFGVEANTGTPGIANSKRHPSPGCRMPDAQPALDALVEYSTSGITPGAGRSRRQLGVHLLTLVPPCWRKATGRRSFSRGGPEGR
jgi:hypothetical protein